MCEQEVRALNEARAIWIKIAQHSNEAARAFNILEEILSKIPEMGTGASTARVPPTNHPRESLATSTTTPDASVSSQVHMEAPTRVGDSEAPALQHSSWSAVNASVPLEKAALRGYSTDWSSAWLGEVFTPKGNLDRTLAEGVDWVSPSPYCSQ